MNYRREVGSPRKAQEGNQKNRRTINPKNSRGRHYGTIHRRIAGASEVNQNGVLTHSYVEALMAETMRSLVYVKKNRRGAPLPQVPPPTIQASSSFDDRVRIVVLECTVNQLAADMATNMAEFFALLRGANHAFSRSTPPPGQGPTVNTPFWPTGFLHENPRSKPGLLFITRQSKTNARSWSHEQWEKSWVHEKSRREQSEELTGKEPRKQRSWHCGTIHHRITEAPKDAQYGTLEIPLSAKVTNDTSGRISGAYHISRDTPISHGRLF
ncbi:hypothetical protein CDL15_Pgr012372 [Punica granatum]|uniref:Uncharacterized protein n=1 Tax=Punica granatum TaxID=22663 RepID=A0A218WMV1_PUNGR|nr:hypothetical protein CDL15_Pgr012372 [Punica granatum]